MNGVNYYVIADNDLQYFLANSTTKDTGYYNPIATQAQQIVEKFLKHVIETYCLEKNNVELLRTHKLNKLLEEIKIYFPSIKLKDEDMRFLTDFYFDVRYPGVDFMFVSKEKAERCVKLAIETKEEVDKLIESIDGVDDVKE